MSKHILVTGYYGFDNTGDEAILAAMLQGFRRHAPSAVTTVLSGDPAQTTQLHGVRSIHWTHMPAIIEAARTADLIVVGGGGLFHDYFAFNPDAVLTSQYSGISYYASGPILAHLLGKPCMLYGVGVGPLFSSDGCAYTRAAFELSCVATVRDAESADIVAALGSTVRAQLTADPAFQLQAAPAEHAAALMREAGVILAGDTLLGVSLRHWSLGAQGDRWMPQVARALDAFIERQDARVVFVPFQHLGSTQENDVAIAHAVRAKMRWARRAVVIEGAHTPQQRAGILAQCDLVLGMRLHSIIFAATAQVPVVALSYDPKVRAIMQQLGCEEHVAELAYLSCEGVLARLERAFEQREAVARRLGEATTRLRVAADENAQLVAQVLHGGTPAAPTPSPETRAIVERAAIMLALQLHDKEQAIARIVDQVRERDEIVLLQQAQLATQQQEMQARIAEMARAAERFQRQIAARDDTYRAEIERTLAQAAAREAALRAERDQQEANVTALYRTKVVRAMAAYWKLRSEGITPLNLAKSSARVAYRGVVPVKLRRELWYRRNTGRGYKDSQEAREERRKSTSSWEGSQPAVATVAAVALAACDGKPAAVARGPDIICFPVIDWDFRFQRPQQVLSQFARAGHRGYYLNIKFTGMHESAVRTRAIGERLCELFVPGDTDIIIYKDRLAPPTLRKALVALQNYAQQEGICDAVLIVQHPFWVPLAEALRETYRWKIVYDCMDDHSGFSDNSPEVLAQEDHLVRTSDLVITTSHLLQDKMSQRHATVVLVPNAGDYAHFSKAASHSRSPIAQLPRPVIGYYGAIAEWFDVAALAEATARHPEWSFVLIGHTFGADLAVLEKLPNVHLLGEKPYAELPGYVAGFDVCTIPFRRIPLTEATNPVKLFEYLATGKPVVARRLPEIEPYADTVALYDTPAQFVVKLEEAVASTAASTAPQAMRARQAVARANTWAARYDVFAGAIRKLYGRASVIIVSYNNLELMQRTLASILEKTEYPNYEVIVVDNGSGPEVTDYLEEMAAEYPDQIKVVLNGHNVGFAAANNVGIGRASGATASEYVVLLNNDVIVTRGWLTTLIGHLDNEQIGIVGPVTNSCGNEARIEVDYADISGIDAFAARYTSAHAGQLFDIGVLAMYCVALRRAVVDEIGPLDEIFGVGMFEDDDYALRIREAGYRVVCAEDIFIHHFGRASFAKMEDEAYKQLFEENKRLFEQKWNRPWVPHRYRSQKEMGLPSRALAGARSAR